MKRDILSPHERMVVNNLRPNTDMRVVDLLHIIDRIAPGPKRLDELLCVSELIHELQKFAPDVPVMIEDQDGVHIGISEIELIDADRQFNPTCLMMVRIR